MPRESRGQRGSIVWAMIAGALLGAAWAWPALAEDPIWDKTVKAAIAEGEVDVHGGPGEMFRHILIDGFHQAYPQIKVNFSGLSGRDAIPKILREREAGIYNWDVYTGGTSSILQSLKPINGFEPLRDAFILPEVLDDKAWLGGLDGGWIDTDKKYIFGFEATVTPVMLVNWDVVSRDQLKTFDDLLRPEFADKIVWDDPRLPGPGVSAAQRFLVNFGLDWLKKLFTEQKITYIANPRKAAEWVVSGKYPIGIGVAAQDVAQFQKQGLGKNVSAFVYPLPKPSLEYAYGTVSLISHQPHPNAAKVYINWLLSKAGQIEWTKIGENSRRVDIPIVAPELAAQPGVAYIAEQSEENLPVRQHAQAIGREFIRAQP